MVVQDLPDRAAHQWGEPFPARVRDRTGCSADCRRHRRYKAVQKPRRTRAFPHGCPDCSAMYAVKHGPCPCCEHVTSLQGHCNNADCPIGRAHRSHRTTQPPGRVRYETKEATLRKRKRVVWVSPATGTERQERCGRITEVCRRKDGTILSREQCRGQVEWVEYTPSQRSHSFSCDEHVTPPLDQQG